MGQILAIVSSKGGVGKTTTAVNLASAFAALDFPTLLVEADPQCGIVANFGFDRFDIPRGLAEVARRQATAAEVTFETAVSGLHLVSSNIWSQAEEAEYLEALTRDPLVLREMLSPMAEAYDYVVIDAPPMLGPITVAVLAAAHRFIVPLQTEPQAFRALGRLVETATQVRERHNPGLIFDGIALTMVDSRTRLSLGVIEQVQQEFPDLSFNHSIPRSVRLSEMALSGRPLVVAAPSSRGGQAYAALAEEILLKHARERMFERAGEAGSDQDDDSEPEDRLPGDLDPDDDPGSAPNDEGPATDLFDEEDEGPEPFLGVPDGADDADEPEPARAESDHGATHEDRSHGAAPDREDGSDAAGTPGFVAPNGRMAIASGRFPEEGGDIHKSTRRGTMEAAPRSTGEETHHRGTTLPRGSIRAIAPGPETLPAPERRPVHTAAPSLFGEDPVVEEWDERFVDLETYMEMESGGTAGAVAAEEDEWDEEWGR